MKKILVLAIIGVGAVVGTAVAGAVEGDADAIMKKSEEARKIPGLTSRATLTVGMEGATPKVKTFTWWRKLQANGVRTNTLTRFHTPAEIRGEGILFLEHEGGRNDVFMYLPAFKKIRRVESASQSQSFMGSSFSYSDFSPPHADEFRHQLVRSEPCPLEKETRCFVIESKPVSEEVRTRTGYSKIIQWIHEKRYLAVHGEYFSDSGNLVKTMDSKDLREVDAKAAKWMAHWVRIEEVATHRFTELTFTDVKSDSALSDSLFTQPNLMRE